MILPTNASILRNIRDSFYYNGIEISKENFSIEEFAKVCSKINDFKHQLRQEKNVDIRKTAIANIYFSDNIQILCKIDKKNIYFGLYDLQTHNILALTEDLFFKITDDIIFSLSHELNKIFVFIDKQLIQFTTIKDTVMLHTFENYIDTIEKSGNSFQNTYELEFVNGYKEYILTDAELKKSIIER